MRGEVGQEGHPVVVIFRQSSGYNGLLFWKEFFFFVFFPFLQNKAISYTHPSPAILSIFECHVRFSISLKFRIKGDLSIVLTNPHQYPLPFGGIYLKQCSPLVVVFFWTKGNQHNIGGLRQNYCLFDGRHTRNIFSCNDDWLIFFSMTLIVYTKKNFTGAPFYVVVASNYPFILENVP